MSTEQGRTLPPVVEMQPAARQWGTDPRLLGLLVAVAAAIPLAAVIPFAAVRAADRPNIVMIFTDDQGWNDVGCYGSEIPTPHIDSLARDGLKLTQFYAASSICTPSRFGLLTGRYPTHSLDHLVGALMFLDPRDAQRGLRAGETTYASLLQQAGYTTALIGKWHLGHGEGQFWPTHHGFDSFFGHTAGCVDFFSLHYGTVPDWYRDHELVSPDKYATDAIADEAVDFIARHAVGEKPFYLHVAFNAPHFGKVGDSVTGETFNRMQPKAEDLLRVPSGITDALRRDFAAKVIGMDGAIGRILTAVSEQAIRDNTLVIFMTDHGGDPEYGGSNLPLRGGKATLFDGGLKVPCLVRWPGRIEPGSQSNAVTCALDCFPTLCAVAGISTESYALDGSNLLPVLEGQAALQERELWWHTGKHAELERDNWTALRQGKWKLVQPPSESPMLFDLDADPNEQHNLVGQRSEVLERLLARTNELLQHGH